MRHGRRSSGRVRRRGAIVAAISAGAVAALGGGLFALDAHDVVDGWPGLVTLAPPHPEAAPFPQVPGATGAVALAPVMAPLPAGAAIPPPSFVQPLVDALAASPAMGPSVGVLVTDQLTGEVLGALNPSAGFTPASTQKMLTGLAVFAALDPHARLATRVLQDGSRLILAGGGDMLLSAGHGNPAQVDDHAGLADLAALAAAQVRLSGRTTVSLSYDDSLFEDPRIAPAVPPGEQRVFVAPVAALAVNQARADGSKSDSAPRVADPALRAAEVFAAALREAGVEVDGRPERVQGTTMTIPEIARVESATIGEITEWAMQRSDNTITEVLARLVAAQVGLPTTAAGSAEAVKLVVERLGVNLAGAELVDLSGLGRGSRMSPAQLVGVVDVAISGPPALRELVNGNPIGGLTGTLATRFTGNVPATGLVRAKTGSLPGVTALSGTVQTTNGRLLLFAVLADQTPGPGQWGARAAIDDFVNRLAAFPN